VGSYFSNHLSRGLAEKDMASIGVSKCGMNWSSSNLESSTLNLDWPVVPHGSDEIYVEKKINSDR
jgi:hypothetical protein